MPPTVDTAAHTSERLARTVNCTVRRIAPVLPSVTTDSEGGNYEALRDDGGASTRGATALPRLRTRSA